MSILLDTNILLRRAQPGHPNSALAVESVATLLAEGESVCITPQNIAEFWNVATRPTADNGLGLAVEFVAAEIDELESYLRLLPDAPDAYGYWKRLVIRHRVLGSKVHDARLVAAMLAHGVGSILTFNESDFARFEVGVVHPSQVLGRGSTQ